MSCHGICYMLCCYVIVMLRYITLNHGICCMLCYVMLSCYMLCYMLCQMLCYNMLYVMLHYLTLCYQATFCNRQTSFFIQFYHSVLQFCSSSLCLSNTRPHLSQRCFSLLIVSAWNNNSRSTK